MHRNIIRLAAGLTLFALSLAAGAAHAADRIPYSSTYDTGFGRDGSARKLITTAIDNAAAAAHEAEAVSTEAQALEAVRAAEAALQKARAAVEAAMRARRLTAESREVVYGLAA